MSRKHFQLGTWLNNSRNRPFNSPVMSSDQLAEPRYFLALAGPSLEERQELFDFIVENSEFGKPCVSWMRPVRTALENQRMTCYFASVLMSIWLTRPVLPCGSLSSLCVPPVCCRERKSHLQIAYWTRWNQSASPTWSCFISVWSRDGGDETNSTGPLVETSISLAHHFRRQSNLPQYLNLLFFNHRTFYAQWASWTRGQQSYPLMRLANSISLVELLGWAVWNRLILNRYLHLSCCADKLIGFRWPPACVT